MAVFLKAGYQYQAWFVVLRPEVLNLNKDANVPEQYNFSSYKSTSPTHLDLNFYFNMQTFEFDSNIDAPSVSVTVDESQKLLDVIMHEDSSLQTVRDPEGVSNHQGQFIEENTNIVQSDTGTSSESSAIDRLPAEILSEIFLYCLPQDQYLSPLAPNPELAPVLLTRVCRRWRELAIGFPKLWSILQLEFDHDNWQPRALRYDSWLKKSRGSPLSLKIACHGDLTELLELLQPYIPRISSLVLEPFCSDKLFMVDNFHALKELTVREPTPNIKALNSINAALSKLPVSLRMLNVVGMPFSHGRLNLLDHSAWERLTFLDISLHEAGAFPQLLRLCPNLSFLSMMGIIFPAVDSPDIVDVTHTKLQSLHMCGTCLHNFDKKLGLFKHFTLPDVRIVEVWLAGKWPHEEFKAFLTRSKCPLETLIFGRGVFLTDEQRAEYGTLLPSLKLIIGPYEAPSWESDADTIDSDSDEEIMDS